MNLKALQICLTFTLLFSNWILRIILTEGKIRVMVKFIYSRMYMI